MKDFNEQVSNFEEDCKCCKSNLVDYVPIVKVSVGFFIDKSKYLEPTPARFEDIYKIKSISHNGADQNIDSKEDNENKEVEEGSTDGTEFPEEAGEVVGNGIET